VRKGDWGRQSGRQSEFPLTPTLSPRRGSTVSRPGHDFGLSPIPPLCVGIRMSEPLSDWSFSTKVSTEVSTKQINHLRCREEESNFDRFRFPNSVFHYSVFIYTAPCADGGYLEDANGVVSYQPRPTAWVHGQMNGSAEGATHQPSSNPNGRVPLAGGATYDAGRWPAKANGRMNPGRWPGLV
jgi:hypothetical protein